MRISENNNKQYTYIDRRNYFGGFAFGPNTYAFNINKIIRKDKIKEFTMPQYIKRNNNSFATTEETSV